SSRHIATAYCSAGLPSSQRYLMGDHPDKSDHLACDGGYNDELWFAFGNQTAARRDALALPRDVSDAFRYVLQAIVQLRDDYTTRMLRRYKAVRTPSKAAASFRNSGPASNRQSASSNGSNASPCAVGRPKPATQQSSVLLRLNPST